MPTFPLSQEILITTKMIITGLMELMSTIILIRDINKRMKDSSKTQGGCLECYQRQDKKILNQLSSRGLMLELSIT